MFTDFVKSARAVDLMSIATVLVLTIDSPLGPHNRPDPRHPPHIEHACGFDRGQLRSD